MGDQLASDLFRFSRFELVQLGKSSITVGGLAAAIVIVALAGLPRPVLHRIAPLVCAAAPETTTPSPAAPPLQRRGI